MIGRPNGWRQRAMSTSIPSPGAVAVSSGPRSTIARSREIQPPSMRRRSNLAASKRRDVVNGNRPVQLPLVLVIPPVRSPPSPPAASPKRLPITDRFAGMDARMSTSDVVRIIGVNRSTLFRWGKKGLFPPKHISGGWLRSDVEKWFAAKAVQDS